MKKLILSALFFPFAVMPEVDRSLVTTTNLAEVRSGAWPINMERYIEGRDTSYSLIFRNQEVIDGMVLDTLLFPDLGQLKYFGKALTALKTGSSGDIAKFKEYSLKRTDKKFEGTWYLLRLKWSSTEFRQPEAEIMRKTINGL